MVYSREDLTLDEGIEQKVCQFENNLSCPCSDDSFKPPPSKCESSPQVKSQRMKIFLEYTIDVKNKSLLELSILGNENFQLPFKFCMQLGTQGDEQKCAF